MYKYVIRRLLLLIPVLLGISLLVFAIMYVTPGDPAQLMLGENAPKAAVEALREKMGLNDPFIVQYFRFVGKAITGDFGRSYTTGREVFAEIFSRFPNTLVLAILGIIISVVIGIPIGIISATKQYSAVDSISMVLDYIRTARAKGVSEKVVINKHALKNALIPIITVVGLQFGHLLGGAVLTESVYSWPGVGRMMVDAIRQKDSPTVLAAVIFLAAAFSIVNLLVDILYAYVDPRIKSQYK